MAYLKEDSVPSMFFDIANLTADMALTAANIDHANTTPRLINAQEAVNSLTVEFKWQQLGGLTVGALPFQYVCQVNFEEQGRIDPTPGQSQDSNYSSVVAYQPTVGAFTGEYTEAINVNLGAAAGELDKGIYTVTVLFFVEYTTPGNSRSIAGFKELGKINVY